MKKASPRIVPNVFVQEACLGNHWAAQAAWTRRREELGGFSPYELWDHPELFVGPGIPLTHQPSGAFAVVTVRGKIIRALRMAYSHESTMVVAHSVGNLPFVTVREEDPAPIPNANRYRRINRMPTPVPAPSRFDGAVQSSRQHGRRRFRSL